MLSNSGVVHKDPDGPQFFFRCVKQDIYLVTACDIGGNGDGASGASFVHVTAKGLYVVGVVMESDVASFLPKSQGGRLTDSAGSPGY